MQPHVMLGLCVVGLLGSIGLAQAQSSPLFDDPWRERMYRDDQRQAEHQRMDLRLEQQRMADEWPAQRQRDQRHLDQRQEERRSEQQQELRRWAAPHREESGSYLLPSR